MKLIIVFGALAIFGGLAYTMWPTDDLSNGTVAVDKKVAEGALANVLFPDILSQNAQMGKLAFEVKCVSCHGTNAAGQAGVAPPLVHIIYEPKHHGDESFQRAAALGVRAHHWSFGNMPAVEGLTRADVKMIIAYIRELQRANGIN
jgi:mono/diheme cytochrome c family protein